MSNTYRIARFIAIISTATFAGLMFCFLLVVDRMLFALDKNTYALVMQELIKAADVPPVVPAVVILILLSSAVMLFTLRKRLRSREFALTAAGFGLFFVFSFLVTIVLNVPVNNEIAGCDLKAVPENWDSVRATWDSFNYWRVVSSFIALGCFVLTPPNLESSEKYKK